MSLIRCLSLHDLHALHGECFLRIAGFTMTVLYFATAAQIAGCASEDWDVAEGLTVDAFWAEAEQRHPGLAAIRGTCRLASGQEYVGAGAVLDPMNETAVLPPVSGG